MNFFCKFRRKKKKEKKREWKSNQGQNQGGRSLITTGRIYSPYNCGWKIGGKEFVFEIGPTNARSEDPIEGEIRQAASNGRNNFHAIAARFGPTDPRGVDRKTCPIYQQFSRGGGIRSKWINSRGGSATICFITKGKISGAACVTAEELKTASKINSRPLIQNTYSTCDTFAV